MRLTGLVNFKPLKEETAEAPIKEAESVDYASLSPAEKKQVDTLVKLFGGKQFQVFDGIHGKILNVRVPSPSPSGHRFTPNELKGLVAAKVRWVGIANSKEYVSIGI